MSSRPSETQAFLERRSPMLDDADPFITNARRMVKNLNSIVRFLSELYPELRARFLGEPSPDPNQLSDILLRHGFTELEIQQLAMKESWGLYSSLLSILNTHLAALLASLKLPANHPRIQKGAHVISRCYGLDGNDPATLQDLGSEYGVYGERIRQMRDNALEKLRQPDGIARFEFLVSQTARSILCQGHPPF